MSGTRQWQRRARYAFLVAALLAVAPPALAQGLYYKEIKKDDRKLRFKLHGVCPTDVDLGEFLAKLTGKPFFKNVELMYSHERQDRGHVMREFEVAFTMDLTGAAAKTSVGAGR